MRLLMFTNTFTPYVGGVARSVESFTDRFRELGHRVVVVAPTVPGMPADELDVVRVPAMQHFSGGDFAVALPVPKHLHRETERLRPQLIHSHHPFLLGDTALRHASRHRLPVVFTHHTLYEEYTHYVPGNFPRMRRFAIELTVGYCNLCDAVIAPSESVEELLRRRGVETRIEVIPTGVRRQLFAAGDRQAGRRRHGVPGDAFLVGHVGRLAVEKNLPFLARALAELLRRHHDAQVLIAGEGPARREIEEIFAAAGVRERVRFAGVLTATELADVYCSFDVFAFASHSETQGMVLTEAMAAGVPVVALDGPGVREVVRDRENGRLLPHEDLDELVAALEWVRERDPRRREGIEQAVAATAEAFSLEATAEKALALYDSLLGTEPTVRKVRSSYWARARRRLAEEWRIARNIANAASDTWLPSGVPLEPPGPGPGRA